MRREDEIQIPLDQIDSMRIDKGTNSLVVRKRRPPKLTPEERRIKLNPIWNSRLLMPVRAKAQAWINDEGAQIDVDAGGRNENLSHFMTELDAAGIIESTIRTYLKPFPPGDLIERFALEARRIETDMDKPEGSLLPFVLEGIEIIGTAKGFGAEKIETMKKHYVDSL